MPGSQGDSWPACSTNSKACVIAPDSRRMSATNIIDSDDFQVSRIWFLNTSIPPGWLISLATSLLILSSPLLSTSAVTMIVIASCKSFSDIPAVQVANPFKLATWVSFSLSTSAKSFPAISVFPSLAKVLAMAAWMSCFCPWEAPMVSKWSMYFK